MVGVRSSENKYTSPIVSVHLYYQSQHKANVGENNRTVLLKGHNDQYSSQGPQNFKAHDRMTTEGETLLIPIEDIITINSQLEVKKGIQADIQSTIIPTYDFLPNRCDDCWNSVKTCCDKPKKIVPAVNTTTIITNDSNRNTEIEEIELPLPPRKKGCCDKFRCWCCRKKILMKKIQRREIKTETDAQRVITMNIEYSKYSNIDTPSHTRLLSGQDQLEYYKRTFYPEKTLTFYLVNNTEFDPANFEVRKKEAEVLARTVMQLKAMKGDYPSERELENILDLNYKQTFGDLYREPTIQISLSNQNVQPISQRF